jgi:chromosome segregation ATPase
MQRIDAQPELGAVVDAGLDARFNQLTEWLGSVVVELTTTVRTGQTELAQALANPPPPPPPPPPGVDPAQLDAALARTSEELRARIDANATTSTVDANLAELGQRVTTLTDGLAATLDSLDNMGARLNEVQVAVAAAATRPQGPTGVDPAQLEAALARTTDELRARIDTHASQVPDLASAANARTAAVDAHLAELGQRVTTLTDGLAATLDSLDNLGARLNEVQVAVAAAASQPPVPAGLDAGQLEAALARTTDELRSRLDAVQQNADAAATRVDLQTDRVLEQLAASSPVRREDLERVDAGLVDIRGRINQLGEVADSVNALRNAAAHQPDLSVYVNPLGAVLQEVRADMQGTRAELVALSRTVSDIRSEARRGDQEMGGAGAALVASAAAAMARLEGRIDNEFDAVSRQMEALGTLVSQAIESVHRMESQVVGVQPVSERVRTAAASVLDSLRNTSRHRSPLRYGNPPPNELEE